MLALGCLGPDTPRSSAPSAETERAVADAVTWLDPSVALVPLDALITELPLACPTQDFDDGPGLRQYWEACPDAPARGALERYEDGQGAWMEVSGLVLNGEQLDGAIEHQVAGDLSTLEMAGTFCDADGCAQTDLSWTLVEREGLTDVLVSGTLLTPSLGAVEVEGTFRLMPECESPVDGLLLLEGEQTHTLRLGQECSGCAAWGVDGAAAGSLCAG